jgi:multiple sugar transport system substrate-binding protein/putative aldouronate transport system substrate-binding protein
VSEVGATAQAFINAGLSKVGIASPDKSGRAYCTFIESSNNAYGFDPIFQAKDAWPGYWVTDNAGKVSYGTTSANTKQALGILADWYARGLLDPEIGVRDSSAEVVTSNSTGIFFAPWWAMAYGNLASLENDPSADWQFYPVYTDDGKWYSHMKEVGTTYILINKNVSPDVVKAVIINQNFYSNYEGIFDNSVNIGWYPLHHIIADMYGTEYEYRELINLLEGKTQKEDYNDPLSGPKIGIYNNADTFFQTMTGYKKGTPFGTPIPISAFDRSTSYFQRAYAILVGDRPYSVAKPDKEVFSAVYGATDLMQRRWANLQALEDETIMKIITGKEKLDYFDSFVAQWRAEGGNEITAEVQSIVDSQK